MFARLLWVVIGLRPWYWLTTLLLLVAVEGAEFPAKVAQQAVEQEDCGMQRLILLQTDQL
jgi:hypothetical protein